MNKQEILSKLSNYEIDAIDIIINKRLFNNEIIDYANEVK